jgi:hypothetical protein
MALVLRYWRAFTTGRRARQLEYVTFQECGVLTLHVNSSTRREGGTNRAPSIVDAHLAAEQSPMPIEMNSPQFARKAIKLMEAKKSGSDSCARNEATRGCVHRQNESFYRIEVWTGGLVSFGSVTMCWRALGCLRTTGPRMVRAALTLLWKLLPPRPQHLDRYRLPEASTALPTAALAKLPIVKRRKKPCLSPLPWPATGGLPNSLANNV